MKILIYIKEYIRNVDKCISHNVKYILNDIDISKIKIGSKFNMKNGVEIVLRENDTILIDNRNKVFKIIKRVNMMGQEVNENAKGVIIEIYEDGTMIRTIKWYEIR